jgi:hypothetical protein
MVSGSPSLNLKAQGGTPAANNTGLTLNPNIATDKKAQTTAMVRELLGRHSSKNFVQRVLEPSKFPILPRPDLGEGAFSTHLMSWSQVGEGGKRNVVYPNVVQNPESGELEWLGGNEALAHAQRTGEFIEFSTPEEAEWFSINYKMGSQLESPETEVR